MCPLQYFQSITSDKGIQHSKFVPFRSFPIFLIQLLASYEGKCVVFSGFREPEILKIPVRWLLYILKGNTETTLQLLYRISWAF